MTGSPILSQAFEHVPGLLLIWVTIYAAYWTTGVVKRPRLAWRDRLIERFGVVEPRSFRMSALAWISFVSLFLELLIVRWAASEIRVFAYFKSLVLIACFLGFGLGCYLTRKRVLLAYTLVPLLAFTFLVEMPWLPLRRLMFNLSGFIGWFSDVHIWGRAYFAGNPLWGVASAAIALSIVVPLFGLLAITFVPLGQLVGWYLQKSPKGIRAYSVNVLASIAGIWLYTLLCFRSTRPEVWFAVFGTGLAIYCWRIPKARFAVLASTAGLLALFAIGTWKPRWWGEESWKGSRPAIYRLEAGQPQTFWSPYQKLTLVPLKSGSETVRYVLNTNDSWYQEIVDLSPAAVARHPELYDRTPVEFHQYNLPYRFYEHPPTVLIAGAGMGNDAAAALRNGAGHVTAVEIDPLIYRKGKEMHFEHPYDSPRVTAHVDDARAFVQNTKDKYDLIVFSILDSHTTSSYYTNIRLDNYVYTVESMRTMRNLLKPDGAFVMSYSSERPWFAGRLRDIITQAFGKPPLTINSAPRFFAISDGDRIERALASNPALARFVRENSTLPVEEASLTTDDWPYLYQQYRGIPAIVWVLSVGLTAICWFAFRGLKESAEGIDWHFFFLGAAFMLMEVQIISKAALLFGTTWLVNSIVITSLLLFILLANWVTSRMSSGSGRWAYWGLFGTLAAGYLVPSHALFFESAFLRWAVSTALYGSPVFFAGIIFISSFRNIGFRAEAFGSNLLGALVGGLLESLSYWTGIQALVAVAAILYFASLATMGQGTAAAPVRAAAGGASASA